MYERISIRKGHGQTARFRTAQINMIETVGELKLIVHFASGEPWEHEFPTEREREIALRSFDSAMSSFETFQR